MKRNVNRRLTKADLVAQTLREEITAGLISRGDKLDQRDLASRFGISPTPVREALMQLAAEGILIHTPNQGVTVADVTADSLEEFEEIYLMREALERLATEQAHAHLSRAEIGELTQIQESFREAMAATKLTEAQLLNYSFHMRIYEGANAARLVRFIETLWTLFPWNTLWIIRTGEAEPASVRQHDDVLRALISGTAREAGIAMAKHVRGGYEALKQHVVEGARHA